MKIMKKKVLPLLITFFTCIVLLNGCTGRNENTQSTSDSVTVPETETETESKAATVKSLTITIANMCGTEIGMFSIIDPVNGKQKNLDSVKNQEVISINASWPDSVTEFQWALYNKKGELCSEGTTDISAAQKSVTIVLNGNGDFESADTSIE